MRTVSVVGFALVAALITGCHRRVDKDSTAIPSSSATVIATKEATFEVEGMHCATCPVTVKTAAESVEGVRSARADIAAKRAWVTYDPSKTNPRAIADAITEAGYPATAVVQ